MPENVGIIKMKIERKMNFLYYYKGNFKIKIYTKWGGIKNEYSQRFHNSFDFFRMKIKII